MFCCLLAPFLAICNLLDTIWQIFSCFWGVIAITRSRFSRICDPGSQNVVSDLVWGHWCFRYVVFDHIGRPRSPRKRPSNLLAPGFGRQASKEGPSDLTLNLDKQAEEHKSTKKQQKTATSIRSPTAALWAQPIRKIFRR